MTDKAPQDALDETLEALKQLLFNVYVRVTATGQGRVAADYDDDERTGVMEQHAAAIEQEVAILTELLMQARIEGASGIFDGLRESVLDPDVVQQVTEHIVIAQGERDG